MSTIRTTSLTPATNAQIKRDIQIAQTTATDTAVNDPAQFAQAVLSVLPQIQEETGPSGRHRGRYGASKVFIAAIWRRLKTDPEFRGVTLDQFKQRLVKANRDRYLSLARADLVGAMDPQEVTQSEISDRGADFHFVLDPMGKEAWGQP